MWLEGLNLRRAGSTGLVRGDRQVLDDHGHWIPPQYCFLCDFVVSALFVGFHIYLLRNTRSVRGYAIHPPEGSRAHLLLIFTKQTLGEEITRCELGYLLR